MDLTSLLNTHVVVNSFMNDSNIATSTKAMFTCTNIEDAMDNSCILVMPMSFDTMPVITSDLAAWYQVITFDSNVAFNGGTGTSFINYLYMDYPFTAGKVSVQLRARIPGGSWFNATKVDIDMTDTVVISMLMSRGATKWIITYRTYKMNKEGVFTLLATDVAPYLTEVATGSHYTYTAMTLNTYHYINMDLQFKYYEPAAIIDKSVLVSNRLFTPRNRILEYTYEDNDMWMTFVLPPLFLFDGSAYDRSEVLESQISELETDLVNLQSDLDDANAAMDVLQDELAEGGTFFDWLSGKVSDSAMLLSIGSTKLAHLKEVLLDPLGAIKTNIARLLVEKWNQNFEAPI